MNSDDNIWKLIAAGDLLGSEKLIELQAEFIRMPPGHKELLDWLIEKNEITEYHAQVFRAGHSGPFRYGDYIVQGRISEGFFSGGFQAKHAGTSHPVILSFVTDEESLARWPMLIDATRQAGLIGSPFLVRCFEAVEVNDFRFLVYEDFRSTPITSMIAQQGQLQPPTACDVIRRLALALQAMHQTGAIHGHVSSRNVHMGSSNSVKLFFDPEYRFVPLLKTNVKPDPVSLIQVDYSAPELAQPGNRPDELTDIYALGCLLYELLSGKPPYPVGNVRDRMQQHATQRVKPLENLGYEKNLAQFVYFMMAKDRSLRFQNMADVIKQLNVLPDSGSEKPAPPGTLPSYASYDRLIRAKLAESAKAKGAASGSSILPKSSLPAAAPSTSPGMPTAAPTATQTVATQSPALQSPQTENASNTGATSPGSETAASPADQTPAVNAAQSESELGLQVDEQDRSTTQSFRTRQKRSMKKTLITLGITLGVLGILGTILVLNYKDQLFGSTAATAPEENEKSEKGGDDPENETGVDPPAKEDVTNANLVEDDDRTLWESPTDGEPLQLENIPGGMRLLLAVKGAKLFENDTESLLPKSLGPGFRSLLTTADQVVGISYREADQLTFSIHDNIAASDGPLLGSFRVRPSDAKPLVQWLAKWGETSKVDTDQGSFYQSDNGWCYLAQETDGNVSEFVVAPEDLIRDLLDNGSVLVSTGMAKLLKVTDRDRHLNLLVIPADLVSPSGATLFSGYWNQITGIMSWYMGGEDKIQAAHLSIHFEGEGVYLETGLNPQLDKDAFTLADELRARVKSAPEIVDNYLLDIDADRHWKKLAREIPDQVTSVSKYSRVGVEKGITLANSWQPQYAAHNLLASLEYTLAFSAGTDSTQTSVEPQKKTPQTIEELLAENRTIEIGNDDLNIAVDKIVAEVKDDYPALPFDFKITINGTHLMDKGITKNQRLVDFKVENKPLGDILAQFTYTATTDKTSAGPSDPKTELIWVVFNPDPDDPKQKQVLITTRTAATREGYTLPSQFVPQ